MRFRQELTIALEAVRKASQLCEDVRASLVSSDTAIKRDRSPVTIADYGAQAVVIHALQQAFPHDPVVAEEDAEGLRKSDNKELRTKVMEKVRAVVPNLDEKSALEAIDAGKHAGGPSGRFWTLDPIDGTKGFLRGDQYAVALALVENGQVMLGVLACPRYPARFDQVGPGPGKLFYAVRDHGAFEQTLSGGTLRRLHVAPVSDPAQAVFCESVESGHSSHGHSAQITASLGVRVSPLRIDSQAKYAAVARGDAAVYLRLPTRVDYEEKIWDHAAGWILVSEAGGIVTDVRGQELDFSRGRTLSTNRGVIATNGTLHEQVVQEVVKVLDL